MADLPDLYRRVAAAQGMGLPDAGLTTMPSTSPRFGLDDAFRLGIGSSLLNQGPLASQTAPPVAPDVEPPTSMTGNRLGDVGMALALMGSGLRGDVLPGIAVFQQLDQRRQQRALLEQKRAERDAQLNRQAFDDAFKVASNQGMPWSVRKKMLGQMKDNPVATVFESLGDETIFSDIQSVLKYVDPEMVTQFQKDPRSVPIAKLESELNVAKGLAERDRENVVVERRVSAIDRLLDSNQSIPPADKAFYIEQMKKRDKMDEELRELRAKRRSAEAGARVDEAKTEAILGPEQPIGAQPTPTAMPPIDKGQRDISLGVTTSEAMAVKAKQESEEYMADLRAAGIDPSSKEGQSLLKTRAERIAKGAPLVAIDTGADAQKALNKKYMDKLGDTYDQLKTAPVQLRNMEEAKKLIPTAKGFMGPFGETKLEVTKFLNSRLGMNINPSEIASAEELRTRIFQNVLENLKKMDAQPSQYQQVIMMESLGKLGTDPNALVGVVDAYADIIRGKVELYNAEAASAEKRSGLKFPFDPIIKLAPKVVPSPPKPTDLFKALRQEDKKR